MPVYPIIFQSHETTKEHDPCCGAHFFCVKLCDSAERRTARGFNKFRGRGCPFWLHGSFGDLQGQPIQATQRVMTAFVTEIHSCMYVYMYVRMYVRMYACMHACTYVRMYVCTYIRTYAWMHACMYVLM